MVPFLPAAVYRPPQGEGLTKPVCIVMMIIILIFNEDFDMQPDTHPPHTPLDHEHLALLAGSIVHVFDYLTTGNTRAALRARLLLARLDQAGPGIEPLRQAVDLRTAGGCRP